MSLSFLRLVQSGAKSENDEKQGIVPRVFRSAQRPQQLKLPFDLPSEPELIIKIVAMDSVHGRLLNEILEQFEPEVVLDLRHAVRFDLPGTSRQLVFSHLSRLHAHYSVDSIPWHAIQPTDLMTMQWGLSPRLLHELLHEGSSRLLLLVPKPDHARLLASYLNRVLSEQSTQEWEMALVG